MSTLGSIRYWLLLLFVILIALSSHPSIVHLNIEKYATKGTILSPYIALVFNLLMVSCLRIKPFLRNRIIVFSLVMFLLFYLITMSFFGTNAMPHDIRGIAISLAAIMIGWKIELDSRNRYIVLLLYAVLVLYVGLMQVYVNIGSFVILDEYKSDNKNSLGVMLAGASFIFLYLAINSKKTVWKHLILLSLFALTFVVLLTIRARASTLSAVAMSLFLFYKRINKNYLLATICISVLSVLPLYYFLSYCFPGIIDYITNSFYLNHEADITSNRIERNAEGLLFLSDHLWFGNLNAHERLSWIHNYPLEKLCKYGLVFSFPLLLIYVYFFVKVWHYSVMSDSYNISNIGYYILLIPFTISLVEPTFPFGPGTACAFNYILFGMSIREANMNRMKRLRI